MIAILLDDGGTFRPAYALGYPVHAARVAIPADSVTVKRLRRQQHALARFDDPDSWVQLTSGAERRALEALQPELLLPLSLNEKILGIMSLGPKQSEEPFSKTDIRLLDSVAAQTGLALENGRLTAAIAAEVAARAKQTRDIEIARDVQQRLFPQDYPPIPGLDYAGALPCRRSASAATTTISFRCPTDHLGIAIGDVSGKGIPASLLMATLRAYLRGAQTIHHQSRSDRSDAEPEQAGLREFRREPLRHVLLWRARPGVARVDLRERRPQPPMLFRHTDGDREVLRLDTGGPVIGLMEDCLYQQGHVTLARGDVLVAYTDGVSEAMNAADDEWGEDRMKDAVWPKRELDRANAHRRRDESRPTRSSPARRSTTT